jgi:hypothetical protein
MYDARKITSDRFLEWMPFDRFKDAKKIGESEFAIMYSATWIAEYVLQNRKVCREKKEPRPVKVALKRLNESQNMSIEYLNRYNMFCIYLLCTFLISIY